MTGADVIADQLKAQGIGTVFSLAGAGHTYLLQALEEREVAIVSNRHESGAVGAADGYARTLADQRPMKPGVALIVSPQGLANAIPALTVAQAIGSPVVVLAAYSPSGFLEPHDIIASQQLAMVRPVTKHAEMVTEAEALADGLRAAIATSLSDRPGPVVLFVAQALLDSDAPASDAAPVIPAPLELDKSSIEQAASLLDLAERPLVIAGLGAFRGRAADALGKLAAKGIAVVGNGSGRGLVPEDHQSGWSWPYAQRSAHLADCVLVVGEILTQRLGFGLPPRYSPQARFIEVNSDPKSFNRNRPTDVALIGEAGPILEELGGLLRRSWSRNWLIEDLQAKNAALDELSIETKNGNHPLALARALEARKPDEAMIVGDGADIQNWLYCGVRIARPGGFIDHFPLGAMGSGTAMAVGAAAALAETKGPDAPPVLLVTGDGAMGFYPAELHAAALARLDLKVIIGNDSAWGTEAHGQQQAIGRTINTELGDLPYARMAEGFGCAGFTCSDPASLDEALETLLSERGPALLDVKIDPAAGAELKSGSLVSSILFSDIEAGKSALEDAREESP